MFCLCCSLQVISVLEPIKCSSNFHCSLWSYQQRKKRLFYWQLSNSMHVKLFYVFVCYKVKSSNLVFTNIKRFKCSNVNYPEVLMWSMVHLLFKYYEKTVNKKVLSFFHSSSCIDSLCRVHRDCRNDRRNLPTFRHCLKHPKIEGRIWRGQSAKFVPRQRSYSGKTCVSHWGTTVI